MKKPVACFVMIQYSSGHLSLCLARAAPALAPRRRADWVLCVCLPEARAGVPHTSAVGVNGRRHPRKQRCPGPGIPSRTLCPHPRFVFTT